MFFEGIKDGVYFYFVYFYYVFFEEDVMVGVMDYELKGVKVVFILVVCRDMFMLFSFILRRVGGMG